MNSFTHIINKEIVDSLKPNAVVGVVVSIIIFPVTVLYAFLRRVLLTTLRRAEFENADLVLTRAIASEDFSRHMSPTVTPFFNPKNKD